MDRRSQGAGLPAPVVREVPSRHVGGRQIFLVDADVEARLLKLLFHIDLAFLNQREKVTAHPGDLGAGEAMLCDIDGLPGEMG